MYFDYDSSALLLILRLSLLLITGVAIVQSWKSALVNSKTIGVSAYTSVSMVTAGYLFLVILWHIGPTKSRGNTDFHNAERNKPAPNYVVQLSEDGGRSVPQSNEELLLERARLTAEVKRLREKLATEKAVRESSGYFEYRNSFGTLNQ